MLTLSFESSAKAASAALTRGEELIAEYTQCAELTHSRTLLPMAEDMLKSTGFSIEDIDLFACARGPGSFTGIRIGIATVKGLAWASEKPCIGVSTLEAMAWNGVSAGGYICCVMDARRSQVYNAIFEIQNGVPVRIRDDRAVSLEELTADVRSLESEGRAQALPVLIVGDGTEITEKAFESAGVPFRKAPSNLVCQNAWGVAMASLGKAPVSSEALLPVYLRLSQAERERNERLAREAAEAAGR